MPIYQAQTRFASVLVEHLPSRVELLLRSELAARPIVILRPWDERVLDANPLATETGVGPGDSRRRVEQLCSQAIILTAREELYAPYNDALHAAIRNFARTVEIHGLGHFFIEIGKLARTFPSERALGLELVAQTDQTTRLNPSVGIAGNKYTAATAARLAAEATSRVVVVPPGKERQFLKPLPISALPNPPTELARRLQIFGIGTLGDFAELPSAAVVLQFGAEFAFFHDLARGIDDRPLAPYAPPPTITRTLSFTDPVSDRGLLLAALERAANRVAKALDEGGYITAALSMIVLTTDHVEHNTGATINPPSADPDRLRRAVGNILNHLKLSRAVVGVTVTAYPLHDWHRSVQQLVLPQQSTARQIRQQRLVDVLQRLRQRFGEAVVRLASVIGAPRPLAIEVQQRPDGAPVTLKWGGWSRFVIRIYEDWYECRQWWEPTKLIQRTYYQVEATGNLVFTVFRDPAGRWFLDRRRVLS